MYILLDAKALEQLKGARIDHFTMRESFLQLFQSMYVALQAEAKVSKDAAYIETQNRNLQGIAEYHNSADNLVKTLETLIEDTQTGYGLSSDHIAQVSIARVLEFLMDEMNQAPAWNKERNVAIFRAIQYAKALSDLLDYLTNIPAEYKPKTIEIEGKLFALKPTHLEND